MFKFRLGLFIAHYGPTTIYLGSSDFGFDRRRRNLTRRPSDPFRCRDYQLIALDFGQTPTFGCRGNVNILLALKPKPLNRTTRGPVDDIDVGSVVVNRLIPVGNICDVNGLLDVGDILGIGHNSLTQDGFADVANVDEIVISRTDVELDIDCSAERTAFYQADCFRR